MSSFKCCQTQSLIVDSGYYGMCRNHNYHHLGLGHKPIRHLLIPGLVPCRHGLMQGYTHHRMLVHRRHRCD